MILHALGWGLVFVTCCVIGFKLGWWMDKNYPRVYRVTIYLGFLALGIVLISL